MAKILSYIKLLRVRQWYKNLVVFLPIFFVGYLFRVDDLLLTLLGFVSLALISSSSYVINDLADLKADKTHPEKKTRPLAGGQISKLKAVFLAVFLLFVSLLLAQSLGEYFFYSLVALFILTQLYSFFLKKILFADILMIAVFFVIRAVSGAYVINVKVSPWLILCPFFLSLFLSVGKRYSDVKLLKEKAAQTRKVLKEYNLELTSSLMTISTTLLIISYALYCFQSLHQNLLYTLPFALFVIFRFFNLISRGSAAARHPEKVIKDVQIVIGIILWVAVAGVLIYL